MKELLPSFTIVGTRELERLKISPESHSWQESEPAWELSSVGADVVTPQSPH